MKLILTLGPLVVLALVACVRMHPASPSDPADLSASMLAEDFAVSPVDFAQPSTPDGNVCLPPGATCTSDDECCAHSAAGCAGYSRVCCDIVPCPGICPSGTTSQCVDCGPAYGAPQQFCWSGAS